MWPSKNWVEIHPAEDGGVTAVAAHTFGDERREKGETRRWCLKIIQDRWLRKVFGLLRLQAWSLPRLCSDAGATTGHKSSVTNEKPGTA